MTYVNLYELTKLEAEAEARRKEKIDAANREFDEEMSHIKWARAKLGTNGSKPRSHKRKPKPEPRPEHNGTDPETLVAGVEMAVGELKRFTADDVAEWLDKRYPRLAASERRTSIAVRLGRLTKNNGLLEVVEKGLRGKPQVFKLKETPK
jgi:hypothetical protein